MKRIFLHNRPLSALIDVFESLDIVFDVLGYRGAHPLELWVVTEHESG